MCVFKLILALTLYYIWLIYWAGCMNADRNTNCMIENVVLIRIITLFIICSLHVVLTQLLISGTASLHSTEVRLLHNASISVTECILIYVHCK